MSYEKKPIHTPELNTSLRYSFADDSLQRSDIVTKHVSGLVRILTYPQPETLETKDIQSTLSTAGLVLGTEIEGTTFRERIMRIPNSARPLTFDASSESQGMFSYGDDLLFYDIGKLLASAGHYGLVLDDEIGSNIAFVEFTKSTDERLFFVPGVEYHMRTAKPQEDIISFYQEKLAERFQVSLGNAAVNFQMGFRDTINELG